MSHPLGGLRRRVAACLVAGGTLLAAVPSARAQDAPTSGDAPPDSVALPEPGSALPVFATLGLGYGRRSDPCTSCPSPDNTDSFTGHLSLGKRLGHGLGVGIDASVWRRGHPGPLGQPDSAGVSTPTTLSNMLGNASLTFSFQVWHVFVRAGGGLAWEHQDLVDPDPEAASPVVSASGIGIGYTLGGGLTLPVAPPISLAFFANWNVGAYDLASPVRVVERDAKHEYLELGVGVTLR